jgi:predicted dehydrogenase
LYEVVGVTESDERRREALGEVPVLGQDELLKGVDAVLVETAVRDQTAAALRAAAAGVHVHLEKPGGTSLARFREIVVKCDERKRIFQLGYMFRGNPAFEFCLKAVRDGWLGEVTEINGVIGKVAGERERGEAAEFAGGMMFELGCHLIDPVVAMLGRPKSVHPHLRRGKVDKLAENTLAVLEYEKALGTIRSSALDVEGSARRQFSVHGTQGAIAIHPLEPPKLTLTLDRPRGEFKKGAQAVELRKMAGRYDDQLAGFARMIRGEAPLDYSGEHEVAVLETVLRASGMD